MPGHQTERGHRIVAGVDGPAASGLAEKTLADAMRTAPSSFRDGS